MKTNHYWGIASGLLLLPFTIRLTKKQAIEDYVARHELRPTTWPELRDVGYKVVKVDCTWEEKAK